MKPIEDELKKTNDYIVSKYYSVICMCKDLYINERSPGNYIREASRSGDGSGGSRGRNDSHPSYAENLITISVLLDNVPDQHHVPGVTQIVTEFVFRFFRCL